MRMMNSFTAIREAMFEEMKRDDSVILLGEDVRMGVFGTSTGLLDAFGPERVFDTPLSEGGFSGTGIGAAMVGMRPIIDLAMGSFMYVGMDQFVSMAAKTTYTYGGQFKVPIVFRAGMVYNANNAAQHSDRPYPMFMNVPGLKIVVPSCAEDMYGLLKSSIRDDDPVIFFEDRTITISKQPVADEEFLIPLGKGKIKREGTDITIVAIGGMVATALAAAEELAKAGISAEVIDPRTLVPLDKKLILESVRKTGHFIVVDPAHKTCSAGSEIASIVAQEEFSSLKSAPQVIATADVPIPFSKALEGQLYPSVEKILNAVNMIIE